MRVLLLNIFTHQKHLLKSVCDYVLPYGIEADAYFLKDGYFYSPLNNKTCFLLRNVHRFLCKYTPATKISNLFFYIILFFFWAKKYDVIDFQGLFGNMNHKIIPQLKKRGIKIKITIWGSDFYRKGPEQRAKMLLCFEKCDIIQIATNQMKEDFLCVYPQFESKIRVIHFGLSQLEELHQMKENVDLLDNSFMEIPQGKMVLVCGYNGSPAQQHDIMLEAIANLPVAVQNNLYLLFPMTYNAPVGYIERIDLLLQKTTIPYKIFRERLSLEQLMILRLNTKIAINIQKTDAFAASIQEHIMAGNLLVVGEWLPYRILEEHGIFLCRTSIKNLTKSIKWAIENYNTLQQNLNENQEKMYQLSSWKYVSDKWANIYQELS